MGQLAACQLAIAIADAVRFGKQIFLITAAFRFIGRTVDELEHGAAFGQALRRDRRAHVQRRMPPPHVRPHLGLEHFQLQGAVTRTGIGHGAFDRQIARTHDIQNFVRQIRQPQPLLHIAFGKAEALGKVGGRQRARLHQCLKRREFVGAAEALGLTDWQIIRRHIIPNVVGPVIVFVTLTIPAIILAESFLSFLGLGVQEPYTSWGVLISEGAGQMESAPWMLIYPAIFLGVTLFCFNFIGDGLRDALDPKDR